MEHHHHQIAAFGPATTILTPNSGPIYASPAPSHHHLPARRATSYEDDQSSPTSTTVTVNGFASSNGNSTTASPTTDQPSRKKQKRNKPTLSCFECVERKTKVCNSPTPRGFLTDPFLSPAMCLSWLLVLVSGSGSMELPGWPLQLGEFGVQTMVDSSDTWIRHCSNLTLHFCMFWLACIYRFSSLFPSFGVALC